MRDAPAAIVADELEPREAQRLHQLDLSCAIARFEYATWRAPLVGLRRIAVAAQIAADDGEACGEPRRDLVPDRVRLRIAVQAGAAAGRCRRRRNGSSRRDVAIRCARKPGNSALGELRSRVQSTLAPPDVGVLTHAVRRGASPPASRRCRPNPPPRARSAQLLSSIGTPLCEPRCAIAPLDVAGRQHRLARFRRRRRLARNRRSGALRARRRRSRS